MELIPEKIHTKSEDEHVQFIDESSVEERPQQPQLKIDIPSPHITDQQQFEIMKQETIKEFELLKKETLKESIRSFKQSLKESVKVSDKEPQNEGTEEPDIVSQKEPAKDSPM